MNRGQMWTAMAIAVMTTAPAMAQSRAVTHVDSEKVAAALAGGRGGGSLISTKDFTVNGSHRSGPGEVEVHATETDIFYVTDGEATLVVGGTVVGGKTTAPGQIRGTDITGGQTQRLKKGDVVTIPAGTPHWFKALSTPTISYLTIKVLR